jgi:alpha-mannosidase
MEMKEKAFIVPHTHWDREWYKPFEYFRNELVKLIDYLLDILSEHDYRFMLDGQTIMLEDYFEIRPERREELLNRIREGKIAVGPWYLLPDEWLANQESLIRNLEFSFELAKECDLDLMPIAYLPDQFGHTRAIPQLITDLTNFKAAVIWRGVGKEVVTVPFSWKSDLNSSSSLFSIYMPYGYGNAATLPDELDELEDAIRTRIRDLSQYSPLPVYLLMNGTDHQLPQSHLIPLVPKIDSEEIEVKISLLDDYVDELFSSIRSSDYIPPEYAGEFRSSARAHLLQDTFSARMWIKQWNQKVEDLLAHYAEPINTYAWLYLNRNYPSIYLKNAWRWHLHNQPHDSICGCSIDQTHEEMRSRYSWAETIANSMTEDAIEYIKDNKVASEESSLAVFNPSNCSSLPMYFEFTIPKELAIKGIESSDGIRYDIQSIIFTEDILFESTFSPSILKSGLKILPGRNIMGVYINEITYSEGDRSDVLDIRVICDEKPFGDFDIEALKQKAVELAQNKKYKKFEVKVTKGFSEKYCSVAYLDKWSFTNFTLKKDLGIASKVEKLRVTKNKVENQFYKLKFNRDGTFDLIDKKSNQFFSKLHKFEDFGDRGDEYTFGRLEPEKAILRRVKRKTKLNGQIVSEIKQTGSLKVFKELSSDRKKRKKSVKLPVSTTFRFYRDLNRIDISTKIQNKAKEHRLRICFDLPFKATETLTSTHFGFVKRKSDPEGDETYAEAPSGIQPQKRFIRIDDPTSNIGFTLINKGLPEVELVEGSRLALTLLRSVGFLSRSDFPERPMHAGPFLETPGAQEMHQTYNYDYSLVIHEDKVPITETSDQAEAFSLTPKSIDFPKASINTEILKPILTVSNPWIKISSLRVQEEKIFVTLYNLDTEARNTDIFLNDVISSFDCVRIDGSIKERVSINDSNININFEPLEIKLCVLRK